MSTQRRKHIPSIRMCVRTWAQKIWTAFDTPLSRSLNDLSDLELLKVRLSPEDYQSPSLFYADYQAVKLLSKFPALKTGLDTRAIAVAKFFECEDLCKETNKRFFGWRSGNQELSPDPSVSRVLFYAARKISDILGPVPSLSELDCSFGPGASFSTRGDTSSYKKMNDSPECTVAFTRILPDFLRQFPSWMDTIRPNQLNLVMGSELTVVPKDAKTDRPICVEPLLNGLYQNGVGSFLKHRLARYGINLRDQGINQSLSKLALERGLATVDFSSASDTIAYGLVLELLPFDWVEFLDIARSPSYKYEGKWRHFHKFSSMGNGYTFELESLIFYALACSVCRELEIPYETGVNLSVYGDDVILPRGAFDLFAQVSQYCGLTVNREKSFAKGLFYESCGTDWFLGLPVRPVFLREVPKTLQEVYYVANITLEMAKRYLEAGGDHETANRLMEVHAWVISLIPRGLRLCVPYDQGHRGWTEEQSRRCMGISSHVHSGLWSDFDVACPRRHRDFDGFTYRLVTQAVKETKVREWPFCYALYNARTSQGSFNWRTPEPLKGETPEARTEGYTHRQSPKRTKVSTSFWPGAWPLLPVKWSRRAVALCSVRCQAPQPVRAAGT